MGLEVVIGRVIELLYFDKGSQGRNATFVMPPPGVTHALIREPSNPQRLTFAPAKDIAHQVATKGVDVEDSKIYCELNSNLHSRIDDHVTELNEPHSHKGDTIIREVSSVLSNMSLQQL